MSETIVIGGELQIPYHDPKMFGVFVDYLSDVQPDKLIIIGDYMDCPAPSRWNRGTIEEYAGNLEAEMKKGREYLDRIRGVYAGFLGYHLGNHEKRIDSYTRKQAPALASLAALKVSSLLDFSRFGVQELPTYYKAAPNFLTTHGDLGPLSKYGGGTALSRARAKGVSVACGHTHRHGIIHERFGTKTVFGMETGHMMDLNKASYVDSPNWSAGWATLDVDSHGGIHPHLVTYRNGRIF